ncbi:MAG TPA: protein kinase family protein, partial [Actinopolymorphaceae bacterium]|nr:protein kinase family protein [Actinopolymorphaceae bacterium]
MHPTDVDPGVTLAGRYRVAELLAETPGDGGVAQTWRAVDEVLSRSVVVHVLAADDPRSDHLLEASRRAATAADVRFLRVLDAMRDDGVAYVVREWVAGRSLGTVLAEGPLPPHQAGLLVREVAEALTRAHDQGLTHERLDPDSIVVTDSGSLKIVGLATQAALTASRAGSEADPARVDALGLGRLLYAALTGRWPTGPRCGLPAAPRAADGSLLSPRQCRAGVPRSLDEITERILVERPRSGTPLTHPREIATALTEAVGVTPIEGLLPTSRPQPSDNLVGPAAGPRPARYADEPTEVGGRPVPLGPYEPNGAGPGYRDRPSHAGAPGGHRPDDATELRQPGGRGPAGRSYPPPSHRPASPRWRRLAGVFVGLVLLAGTGLLGWQLMSQAFGPQDDNPSSSSSTPPTKPAKGKAIGTKVPIVSAHDYDPAKGGDGEEHPEDVGKAFDGDINTRWETMSYHNNPKLGLLKAGVGIWFDLGTDQDIGSVRLDLVGTGTDLELRAAPEGATEAPASPDQWKTVA